MPSYNDEIIDLFRARRGVVGGPWSGRTLILLHHTGRRTGRELITPALTAADGDAYVICGAAGGSPRDPEWVANLEAGSGTTTIELGPATVTAGYRVVRPGEPDWAHLYGLWRDNWPPAREYEKHTSRRFPVVRLHVPA